MRAKDTAHHAYLHTTHATCMLEIKQLLHTLKKIKAFINQNYIRYILGTTK